MLVRCLPSWKPPRLRIRQFTRDGIDNLYDLNNDLGVMRCLTVGRSLPPLAPHAGITTVGLGYR